MKEHGGSSRFSRDHCRRSVIDAEGGGVTVHSRRELLYTDGKHCLTQPQSPGDPGKKTRPWLGPAPAPKQVSKGQRWACVIFFLGLQPQFRNLKSRTSAIAIPQLFKEMLIRNCNSEIPQPQFFLQSSFSGLPFGNFHIFTSILS
jgi:hypothetical protein